MSKRIHHARGLKALIGLKYISWEGWADATGLLISSLKQALYTDPTFPKPEEGVRDSRGALIWNTNRKDVREWITGKARRGRGYRTDLFGPKQ